MFLYSISQQILLTKVSVSIFSKFRKNNILQDAFYRKHGIKYFFFANSTFKFNLNKSLDKIHETSNILQ